MGHENRRLLVGGAALGHQIGRQRQIPRQRHDAGEFAGITQAGMQHHRTALGKTGQHDLFGFYAALQFALYQRLDRVRGVPYAGFVFKPLGLGAENVVPGRHDITTIQGHRNTRCMREHEADGRAGGQIELGHNGGKVVAVRAQAMQPDDGGSGMGAAGGLDAGQGGGHGVCSGLGCRSVWSRDRDYNNHNAKGPAGAAPRC